MADVRALAQRFNVDTNVKCLEDGQPQLLFEDEEITKTCPFVSFVFSETHSAGVGTLYVTNRRVIWVQADKSLTLGLSYPQIVMHAISRDTETFPKPCIYLQLDEGSEDMVEDDDEDDDLPAPEAQLVPQDASLVDDLFRALCDSAAQNPDPDLDDDGEGEFYFNDQEVLEGLDEERRAAVLAARYQNACLTGEDGAEDIQEDLEQLVGDDPERFDDGYGHDADDEEQ